MRVFISSVRRGLESERDALPGLLIATGFEPARFEDFGALPTPSREACVRGVQASDVYLLLLGPGVSQAGGREEAGYLGSPRRGPLDLLSPACDYIKARASTHAVPVGDPTYREFMVSPALQSAIEAMSLDERLELVEYIESTIESEPIELPEDAKAMIRSRAAELEADPSIGLTWDELQARLGSRWA